MDSRLSRKGGWTGFGIAVLPIAMLLQNANMFTAFSELIWTTCVYLFNLTAGAMGWCSVIRLIQRNPVTGFAMVFLMFCTCANGVYLLQGLGSPALAIVAEEFVCGIALVACQAYQNTFADREHRLDFRDTLRNLRLFVHHSILQQRFGYHTWFTTYSVLLRCYKQHAEICPGNGAWNSQGVNCRFPLSCRLTGHAFRWSLLLNYVRLIGIVLVLRSVANGSLLWVVGLETLIWLRLPTDEDQPPR